MAGCSAACTVLVRHVGKYDRLLHAPLSPCSRLVGGPVRPSVYQPDRTGLDRIKRLSVRPPIWAGPDQIKLFVLV